MRILILGGTIFLGRHVAAEALARGHELTLYTRGLHGAGLFPEATHVRGDRADVAPLRDGSWDAVIDTSGYAARTSTESAQLDAGHYVFVSTCNVYPDWPTSRSTRTRRRGPRARTTDSRRRRRARAGGGAAGPVGERARRADRRPARQRVPGRPGGSSGSPAAATSSRPPQPRVSCS
jgi:hypothetical protein